MLLHQHFQEQAKKTCVFCNPSNDLVLTETSHFLLLFDPFALVPGHILIASKEHYGCLGELPISLYDEVQDLRSYAYEILHKSFLSPVTRYEHGRAGHCLIQSVDSRFCHHYHEHLVPKELSLHRQLIKKFKYIPYQSELELPDLFERYNEYLLVAEPNEKNIFI